MPGPMRALTLLTGEEFTRVAPVLGPCELVEGAIVSTSPGGVQQSQITAQVLFLLKQYAQERHLAAC